MLSPMPRVPAPSWIAAAALVVLALTTSGLLVVRAESGPAPAFLTGPPIDVAPRAAPGRVELAGSGSNLPLTRRLVAAFAATRPDLVLVVHDSIGTTGGVRAVRDGAIDVGLSSRPLSEAELGDDLRVHPYARVAVVFAAHPDVGERRVDRAQVLAMYRGERRAWRDGRPLVVLQRERGDSSHRAVSEALPGFAEVNDEAWRAARFRVLYSDLAMQEALASTPGAVGVFDMGAIVSEDLPFIVLSVDGVAPTAERVASGAYPFVKELSFVTRGEPSPEVRALLEFVDSEGGRLVIEGGGYLPVGEAP